MGAMTLAPSALPTPATVGPEMTLSSTVGTSTIAATTQLRETVGGSTALTLGVAGITTGAAFPLFVQGNVGFYGGAAPAKQTVTGAKGGNAALASLMSALVAIGLFTDTTTA